MLQLRESLVPSLLLGVPYENLKPGPRERSTTQTKRKLEQMEGSARDVRRRCVDCYGQIRQQQSREANAATAKKVKTFCLDYFNEKYSFK